MRHLASSVAVRLVLLAAGPLGSAYGQPTDASPPPALVQLKAGTVDAFDRYVRLTDSRNAAELKELTRLLWIDTLP
jgi:hypothetical protein